VTHRIAFDVFDYVNVIPHPELPLPDGRKHIPDFLVQRRDLQWEVFELKRADTSVLMSKERRNTFYATFNSYLSQCRDYARWFRDSANRAEFQRRYGLTIGQSEMRSVIVAGIHAGLDRAEIHDQLADMRALIEHKTYDDVLHAVDAARDRVFGPTEKLPGVSVHLVAAISPSILPHTKNVLLDIGTSLDRNRVTIYVDPLHRLCIETIDADGEKHRTRARQSPGGFRYGPFLHYAFEVGVSSSFCSQTIEVGGACVAENRTDPFDFDFGEGFFVIGSDILGVEWTNIEVAEIAVFKETLTFETKLQSRPYFRRNAENATIGGPKLVFRGHKFMHTQGHPAFPAAVVEGDHAMPTTTSPTISPDSE
jgi:hypothetical protein